MLLNRVGLPPDTHAVLLLLLLRVLGPADDVGDADGGLELKMVVWVPSVSVATILSLLNANKTSINSEFANTSV